MKNVLITLKDKDVPYNNDNNFNIANHRSFLM